MTLTPKQESTLRHMLGINDPSIAHPKPSRNYAAVLPGNPEFVELEQLGLVEIYRKAASPFPDYDLYRCTDAGRQAAFDSRKGYVYPRSKLRYCAFLRMRDAIPDLTFRDFLTNPEYAEWRHV